ncbi:MAG: hypothetical protein BWZ08_02192 [candidate division BRC1 bacterium ADurb.BinA292]|nr:MAG: hypothetical protein BWZ08_02192 [candidate division BRC1 bacterium ADurb.BinA292]
MAAPVQGGIAPAEGENAEQPLLPGLVGAVAHRRQVGHQANIPEDERDNAVGGDGEDIPDERAAPLRPEIHRVGVREKPIENLRPAEVEEREHAGAGDGEEGHRLGEAIDGIAPGLLHQEQDCGDQRAGVTDADPPDEIDDGEAPGDRHIDAPDADAADENPGDRGEEEHHQEEAKAESQPPEARGRAGDDDAGDMVGHRGGGDARAQQGQAVGFRGLAGGGAHPDWLRSASSSSCGLRMRAR